MSQAALRLLSLSQDSLADMNIAQPYKIPEVAVSLALEHHNPQREMTSRLISDIYGDYMEQNEIAKGFDHMLHSLRDLSLDTPDAPVVSLSSLPSCLVVWFDR